MTFEEFQEIVTEEPALKHMLQRTATGVMRQQGDAGSFGLGVPVTEIGALVLFFPIVRSVVFRVGLPWLRSVERYSELWRMEFDRWVDEQYEQRGIDPLAARSASEALLSELNKSADADCRRAWERLLSLLRPGKRDDTLPSE